jgi:hypothetical protein
MPLSSSVEEFRKFRVHCCKKHYIIAERIRPVFLTGFHVRVLQHARSSAPPQKKPAPIFNKVPVENASYEKYGLRKAPGFK